MTHQGQCDDPLRMMQGPSQGDARTFPRRCDGPTRAMCWPSQVCNTCINSAHTTGSANRFQTEFGDLTNDMGNATIANPKETGKKEIIIHSFTTKCLKMDQKAAYMILPHVSLI
jgi:hypothetical protein